MSDGGWSLIQAHFGKQLKRLRVPGSNKDGTQSIEVDFVDGSQIRVREASLERAWEAVWRHRYPAIANDA